MQKAMETKQTVYLKSDLDIECDGDINVEGMEFLIENILNNQVNCTEITFNVEEVE